MYMNCNLSLAGDTAHGCSFRLFSRVRPVLSMAWHVLKKDLGKLAIGPISAISFTTFVRRLKHQHQTDETALSHRDNDRVIAALTNSIQISIRFCARDGHKRCRLRFWRRGASPLHALNPTTMIQIQRWVAQLPTTTQVSSLQARSLRMILNG